MLKEVADQNEPMDTRGRARKASRSRDMLSTMENRVGNLEEFVGDMKKTLELVKRHIDRFDSIEKQLKEFMLDSLGANVEKMNGLVNSTTEKLAERDDTLEDTVLAMKKEIEELKGELMIYKAALSIRMLTSRPKQQAMDNATKAPSKKLVEHKTDLRRVKSTVELPPLEKMGCVSHFEKKEAMPKQLKQGGQRTMGGTKPRCENQGDSNGNKSNFRQVRAETSYQQDVPISTTVQVKKR
ncbi:hypothetical protein J1N35_025000 [Gossypium stocksii]|uniref:Uncharacterized protein n=1 Tax=Gossypium stocksii TaxID=47602 RepID=A0A9D3V5E8_9ROSI|nr:hypothetical protein J1N35_025000 [Gossypium stocksii]